MAAKRVLLELDLGHGLRESPPSDPLAALRARHLPVLSAVVERLRQAGEHPAVAGLIAHVGPDVLTAAQVQELGAAVEALGAAGKRTICWAEAYGESGNGTLGYHLASHFDELWLQPSGGLALVGTAAAGTFLRGALDRLGIEPQIHARHEYKNAPDALLREAMGPAQREALQRLTASLTDQVVTTVARRRGLTEAAVRAAVAAAPLTAQEALERGFVDHVGYRDEVYAAARRHASGLGRAAATTPERDLPAVTQRYVQRWSPPKLPAAGKQIQQQARRQLNRALPAAAQPRVVAVVAVHGGITLGHSGGSPLGGARAGSDSVCAALRQAGRADEVAAVVLRVDSPGGSYVASDAIHREVLRLREAGTPVIASMSTVAASGGYFAAMGADEILALPGTLTGSIGVFAGKLVIGEALKKLGVTRQLVETGEQATMWAGSRPFKAGELERLDRWLDAVYADFTEKAAAGRGMDVATLEPLARGRVWTGADARDRGLIDQLGGLEAAIGVAAQRAGVTRSKVTVRRFPDVSPLARLRPPSHSDAPNAALAGGLLAGSGGGGLAALGLAGLAHGPERLLAELSESLGFGAGALRLPAGLAESTVRRVEALQ